MSEEDKEKKKESTEIFIPSSDILEDEFEFYCSEIHGRIFPDVGHKTDNNSPPFNNEAVSQ